MVELSEVVSNAEVHVARSVVEIEAIREAWDRLQNHPNSDIDFFLRTNQSREKKPQPYVLMVNRGSQIDALLIGRIEETEFEIKLGYLKLWKTTLPVLNFVYGASLGEFSATNCQLLFQAINRVLDQGEAQLAAFRFVNLSSPLYRAVKEIPSRLQRDYCISPQTHRYMTMPDGVEKFRTRFSTKVRKNHRWQANKLLDDFGGNVRVRCFQCADEIDELFRDAEDVASKTYQRGLGVGFEDNRAMRERLLFEAERSTLCAYVLYVADRPTAFWIGTVYKGTFFSSFMGYDPALARYSPGTFLVLRIIEGWCAAKDDRKVSAIDFGLGDAAYKAMLGDREWEEATVYVFGKGLRSLWLNALRTPVWAVDKFLRSTLTRTQLLSRVKKKWRQHIRPKANQP